MKIVVSFGGNAIAGQEGKASYKTLKGNLEKSAKQLALLAKKNALAVVLGSGPQIGALVLKNEIAKKEVFPMPLDVLDAELEGQLGYMFAQSLQNEFFRRKINKQVVAMITQTLVNKNDPAFRRPTKPIGPFYSKGEATVLKRMGIAVFEDAGRGFRRIVASPKPQKIVEIKHVLKLFESNAVVVAALGGGIPVVQEKGNFKGVSAVIDKDLASALLAAELKAQILLIITSVDFVYLNFGKQNQKSVSKMSLAQAKKFLKQGHFLEGSMKPKIESAINFLESGGTRVIICSLKKVLDSFKGKSGTQITK